MLFRSVPDSNDSKALDLILKFLFISRLPADLQGPLNSRFEKLTQEELADEAQRRWRNRGSGQQQRGRTVATMPPLWDAETESEDSGDEEEGRPVAAAPAARRRQWPAAEKQRAAPTGKPYLCWKHSRFGEEAWACKDPGRCLLAKKTAKKSGNGRAGGR